MPDRWSVAVSALPRSQIRRLTTRWTADPHVLLAIAIVLSVLVIEVISSNAVSTIVVPALAYLVIQLSISLAVPRRRVYDDARDAGAE